MRHSQPRLLAATAAVLALTATACGSSAPSAEPAPPRTPVASASARPTGSPTSSPTATAPATASPTRPPRSFASDRPIVGTQPPAWLGTRVLPRTAAGFGEVRPTPRQLVQRRFTLPDTVAELPGRGFASRTTTPAPQAVIERSTWVPGCPVAATDLSWVRVSFVGFEGLRHTGELLVNRSAASQVVRVFEQLYAARFPIEEMRITRRAELDAPPTGDGNDTGAYACRATRGSTTYSQHAYGLAIDVNPFQNPYVKGDVVLPELASAYLERDWRRPGMITPDGPVVRAFASIGWTWGGTWSSLKDLQHFSANGR